MIGPLGDEDLVRRTSRRLAVQAAGLVATAMVLLIALATFVVVRAQESATGTLLRTTAANADDVNDPPPGAWIILSRGGHVSTSPGLPPAVRTPLSHLLTGPNGLPSFTTLTSRGAAYRVVTQLQPGQGVQVVLDLRQQTEQRQRLFKAMGVAAGLALLLAAGVGVVLGRRAVRPLAQALALQRTFVADASHELRTPLTLLTTRAQLLDSELRKDTHGQQLLADSRGIVSDVMRLGEVVEDLLIAADPRRDDQHEPVDLGELAAGVVASAAAHASRADVTLSVTLSDDPSQLWVQGSPPALRRAVLALVDNAVDHAGTGGRVQLRVRTHRRTVILAVDDSGPGLATKAAEQALQRFHSGGQRAGREHYGLGLALTHDVANRHGGQLRLVASERGTTFELLLPASGT
jgi:signal transduction histidine kinase